MMSFSAKGTPNISGSDAAVPAAIAACSSAVAAAAFSSASSAYTACHARMRPSTAPISARQSSTARSGVVVPFLKASARSVTPGAILAVRGSPARPSSNPCAPPSLPRSLPPSLTHSLTF